MLYSSEPTAVHPVCEDLLLAVLAELPSRALTQARSVSRTFQILADEVLRRRFLDLAEDQTKQLILESCAPYEHRAQHRRPLAFSHFAAPADDFTGDVAHFSVESPSSDDTDVRRLALDDGEMFQQNILSVHLHAAPRHSRTSRAMQSMDVDDAALAPSRLIDYAWTVNLASSLDRFFRSWFLESAGEAFSRSPTPSSSASSSRESSPALSLPSSPARETRSRQLGAAYNPSGRSALLFASISCVQIPLDEIAPEGDEADVLAQSSSSGSRYGSPTSTSSSSSFGSAPRVYEYYFDGVALDVAKVVVLAEENLPGLERGGATRTGPTVIAL